MNLSPLWVKVFTQHEWESSHWSTIGDPRAEDTVIMDWARTHNYIVFTHDLDFGTILSLTHADGPSVIQVRTQDVMLETLATRIVEVLKQNEQVLERGALLVVDETKNRLRLLPLYY